MLLVMDRIAEEPLMCRKGTHCNRLPFLIGGCFIGLFIQFFSLPSRKPKGFVLVPCEKQAYATGINDLSHDFNLNVMKLEEELTRMKGAFNKLNEEIGPREVDTGQCTRQRERG